MKNNIIKLSSLLIFFFVFSLYGSAQENQAKTGFSIKVDTTYKEIEIKTTSQCGMCKTRIEKAVNKLDGIQKADLNVDTQILTVKFDPGETDADEIRTAVTRVGYDADDKKANKRAYKKLPKCCQLGGHGK